MTNLLFGIQNYSFFDSYWAAVHFSSGLLTGLFIFYYFRFRNKELNARCYTRFGILLLILWEYFELSLRYMERYQLLIGEYMKVVIPESFFEIESLTNIMSDLVLGSFGLYLVYQYVLSVRRRRELDESESTALPQNGKSG